jgi:hypothetical protein
LALDRTRALPGWAAIVANAIRQLALPAMHAAWFRVRRPMPGH